MTQDPASIKTPLEVAREIMEAPENFKVCCVCSRIVARDSVHCPYCHAYRYDEDREAVINQALSLAQAFSVTSRR